MERNEKMGTEEVNMEARRKFLKTASKFAIYAPPALMVMSTADAYKIAKSGGQMKDRPYRRRPKKNGDTARRRPYRRVVRRRESRRRDS